MPVVVIELATEAPPRAIARAMLDACSGGVRGGNCELATNTAREPRLADASVLWSDSSERAVHVAVRGVQGNSGGAHERDLVFKDTDARVERWRAVGLTIATLVGDALPRPRAAAEARFDDTSPTTAGPVTSSAAKTANTNSTSRASDAVVVDEKKTTNATSARDRQPQAAVARERVLPRTLWAGLSAATGPGLEQGSFRFGGFVDASVRPTRAPFFGRVGFAYASRARDSGGVSVQWEAVTLGAGAVLGSGPFHLEPRLSLGLENVRAAVLEPGNGKKDSGNRLGASVKFGLDGVWQLGHLGLLATVEGSQAHAPTRIVVEGRDVGTAASTTWEFALGARYYVW